MRPEHEPGFGAKLRAVFGLSPTILCLTGLEDGRVRDVNDSFLATTGFTRDEVIGRVALESARLDEPLIVSLAADDAGRVTEGYAVAVRAATGERPEHPNAHAAKERLECYRYFEAVGLPADGGSVAPAAIVSAPKAATKRAPSRTPAVKRPTKPADRPPEICPTCFMAIPRSGVCDNCG